MKEYYSSEGNIQILIALLKAHGIRKVIASPGNTNLTFVASLQKDSFFTIYSCVDERSAAYMACGLAEESQEPVVLTCTGATASRNYLSGLTEAYYRKLPILAITSSRNLAEIGSLEAQVIDRTKIPNDIARISVMLPYIKDDKDKWECEIKINKAILELTRNGGGPAHINLPTLYSQVYKKTELPVVRVIDRFFVGDQLPPINYKKIAIFIGSHSLFDKNYTLLIEEFCENYNAVVFCDHTSGYHGKYKILYSLIGGQEHFVSNLSDVDILIHIGEISGDYLTLGALSAKEVWRVSEDGEIKDKFRKLRYVFEMKEDFFFRYYSKNINRKYDFAENFFAQCSELYTSIYDAIPCKANIPFSNIWVAYKMSQLIPENSSLHLGILSSLRSWNFFTLPSNVTIYSNVGGFGIDGCVSSLIGASLMNRQKLYFGVFGDLAFFYDMNSLGNRHINNNLRILVINNGIGSEFSLYCYPGAKLEADVDPYISADGHFGKKSPQLIKHYAEDLGFEYLTASNKDEFEQVYKHFLDSKLTEKPLLFEIFTNKEDESNALKGIRSVSFNFKGKVKNNLKKVLNENVKDNLKQIVKNK